MTTTPTMTTRPTRPNDPDGTVQIVGPHGPLPFPELLQGRQERVVYKHMWYDGAPHQGQCEGCALTAWHLNAAVYPSARGVSSTVLTTGRWDAVRRRPGVPHLRHDGPRQRGGRRVLRAARHDALRPRRGVAGQPRRPARGAPRVLVPALGRGRDRHLGPDQPPVPQWTRPGATPVDTLGRHGHHH